LCVVAASLTDEEARLDEEKIDELTKRQENHVFLKKMTFIFFS